MAAFNNVPTISELRAQADQLIVSLMTYQHELESQASDSQCSDADEDELPEAQEIEDEDSMEEVPDSEDELNDHSVPHFVDRIVLDAIDVSRNYEDLLFMDVEFLTNTNAQDDIGFRNAKICNISCIHNGKLYEFNMWNYWAWDRPPEHLYKAQVLSFWMSHKQWLQDNTDVDESNRYLGTWGKGLIRPYEIVNWDRSINIPTSSWRQHIQQFHDLVVNVSHIVAFGSGDDAQIKQAWENLTSVFKVSGYDYDANSEHTSFWDMMRSKMWNPNLKENWHQSKLEDLCQLNDALFRKRAAPGPHGYKLGHGAQVSRMAMQGETDELQQYCNRDTALLVMLYDEALARGIRLQDGGGLVRLDMEGMIEGSQRSFKAYLQKKRKRVRGQNKLLLVGKW